MPLLPTAAPTRRHRSSGTNSGGGGTSKMDQWAKSLNSGARSHWSDPGWSGHFDDGLKRVETAAGVSLRNKPSYVTAEQLSSAQAELRKVAKEGENAVTLYTNVMPKAMDADLKVVQAYNKARIHQAKTGFKQFESQLDYGSTLYAIKGQEASRLYDFEEDKKAAEGLINDLGVRQKLAASTAAFV